MIYLFDYDSFIYKSVYRIVQIDDIREWIKRGRSRDWMEKEIVNLVINRISNMQFNLFDAIEATGAEMESIEYFVTDCKKSFRKTIYPEYKGNRRPNRLDKWVRMVRNEMINNMSFAIKDDYFEADDLVIERAKELGAENCMIITMDKDLKQIEGYFFDYYPEKIFDGDEPVLDQYGNIIKDYKGLTFVNQNEANYNFWIQVLMGDTTDNIKGLKGIGKVKAQKLLKGLKSDEFEEVVKEKYLSVYGDLKEYWKNYHLVKLGKRDLNEIHELLKN